MNVILDLLDTKYGTLLSPKKDGRIEVTQNIVKGTGFNKCSKAFVFEIPGGLLVSKKRKANLSLVRSLSLGEGRVRIPMGVLKQYNFLNKRMRALIADEDIIIRPDNSNNIEKCKDILENLSAKDKEDLFALVLGEDLEVPEIEPSLFLLSKEPIVFRFVGLPIWFNASWVGDEIVVDDKSDTKMFLLPGIIGSKTYSNSNIGFLLLSEVLVAEIKRSLNRVNNENRDLIFVYRPYAEGFYSVHCNPPTMLSEEKIKLAQKVCANVDRFLQKHFRKIDDTDVVEPMPLIFNLNKSYV